MIDLRIQCMVGRIVVFILAPLYFFVLKRAGWRIANVAAVRHQWKKLLEEHPGPWVICANHLTLVDSLILTYGLFSLGAHITHYRAIPWNLPEKRNFQTRFIVAALCYLAKCIPVRRGGDREETRKTLEKCRFLLQSGRNIMIFPEGGRSRSGRVERDNYSYGVGRLVLENPCCRILCCYLRGEGQDAFSDYPKRGERFTIMLSPLPRTETEGQGLRAQREMAGRIVARLAAMEEEYFANRQRYSQSHGPAQPWQERGPSLPQPGLHRP